MRRNHLLITALVFLLTILALAGGCGGSGDTGVSEQKEDTGMTNPPKSALKQLSDFPNAQDGANVQAVIKTDKGDITLDFFPDAAPIHVASFIDLARSGFYNGTTFHRVVPDFVVQGGDPKSKDPGATDVGTGGPGYNLPAEFNSMKHETGTLAMARSQDPNSAGSQFYICLAPQPGLDGQYTVFGKVTSGMDVVNQIVQGDVIREIVIEPKSQ